MQVWGVYLRKVQFGAVGACQGSWGICVWHEHLLLELAADGQGRAGQAWRSWFIVSLHRYQRWDEGSYCNQSFVPLLFWLLV